MIRINSFDEVQAKFHRPSYLIAFTVSGGHEEFFKQFLEHFRTRGSGNFDDETVLRMFLQNVPSEILFPYLAEIAGKRLARESD